MVNTRPQTKAGIQRGPKQPRVTVALRSSQRLQQPGSSDSKRRCNDSETTTSRESLRQDSGSWQSFEISMQAHSFESLPEEILCQIFGRYFSLKERMMILELVSKTFGRVCQLTYRLQKTLRIESISHLVILAPKVGPFVETLVLDFPWKPVDGEWADAIPSKFPKVSQIFCGRLEVLDDDDELSFYRDEIAHFGDMHDLCTWLRQFPAIQKVHFENSIFLNHFFELQHLLHPVEVVFSVVSFRMSLSDPDEVNRNLEMLRANSAIVTRLYLKGNLSAESVRCFADLPHLPNLSELKMFCWFESAHSNAESMEFFVEKVPNLTRLELDSCSLDFGNTSLLQKLEHLEILITGFWWPNEGPPKLLRERDLARIGQRCKSIRDLRLYLVDWQPEAIRNAVSTYFSPSIELRVIDY